MNLKEQSNKRPLILITNDDGINAKGLQELINVAQEYGDVVVVTSFESHSGMSHAISIKTPLRPKIVHEQPGLIKYLINGTPVDAIKLALNALLERKPDLILSGINHGANSSISVIYSGTMGGAMEGSFYNIPAIGFSVIDYSPNADFKGAVKFSRPIIENVLKNGLPDGVCLNVNFPKVNPEEVRGVKICRQAKGVWREEFDRRRDPHGGEYFWLTGYFENFEPDAQDTDEWALKNNYVSIVPVQVDLTAYSVITELKEWTYNAENK